MQEDDAPLSLFAFDDIPVAPAAPIPVSDAPSPHLPNGAITQVTPAILVAPDVATAPNAFVTPLASTAPPVADAPHDEPATGTDDAPTAYAQALYRRYRPESFSGVVGQRHVTDTLRNAVRHHQVGHAYLFCGPRGAGKTSTARVLARAITCLHPQDGEPCNVCMICRAMEERRCLDLVEIDAASNNSVNDIRDLRDSVNVSPAQASHKVYIIDEVHMLSTSAFNALLKTLEEPPSHVLFILATTEVHRLPATIISRCQRYDFRSISAEDTAHQLAYVCASEGLNASPDALMLLATYATGSLRDALSLLDQARAYTTQEVTALVIQQALGLADPERIRHLANAILSAHLAEALQIVDDFSNLGADMRQIARQMVMHLREALVIQARQGASNQTFAGLAATIRAFMQADSTARRIASPQIALELAVIDAVSGLTPTPAPASIATRSATAASAPLQAASSARPQLAPTQTNGLPRADTATVAQPVATLPADGVTLERLRSLWPHYKGELKARKASQLLAILNTTGEPIAVQGTQVTLGFAPAFAMLQGRAEQPASLSTLETVLSKVLGQVVSIRCVVHDARSSTPPTISEPAPISSKREMPPEPPPPWEMIDARAPTWDQEPDSPTTAIPEPAVFAVMPPAIPLGAGDAIDDLDDAKKFKLAENALWKAKIRDNDL